jgi:hypothetical protein
MGKSDKSGESDGKKTKPGGRKTGEPEEDEEVVEDKSERALVLSIGLK